MQLRLIGIDPKSNGEKCPAVLVDDDTGDFYMQGATVTDAAVLNRINRDSPIADHESVVVLPARMRDILLEAARGARAEVR